MPGLKFTNSMLRGRTPEIFRAALPGSRIDILAASLVLNLLGLALPIVILQTYDRILPNDARTTLAVLVIAVGGVLILDAILRVTRSWMTGWAAACFEHRTGCDALEGLLRTGIRDFEAEAPGTWLDRFMAIGGLREFAAGQAALATVDLPFAVLFLALIAWVGGWLVLVPLALLAVACLLARFTGGRLRQAMDSRARLDERRYNFLIEVLNGIHTVKSMGMEALMTRRYERLQESCVRTGYTVNLRSGEAQTVGAMFSQITMVAVAGTGSLFVVDGALTVGGLAACTLLAGRSLQPVLRAMTIWSQFQNIQVARQRVARLFDLAPAPDTDLAVLPALAGRISLRDVRFRYGENDPWILDGIDLEVRAGEVIGIRGANCSGKTTLMHLIAGLERPQSGEILLDGVDIASCEPDSIRAQVACVPQDSVLMQGTILENLTGFAGDERVDRAMEMAESLGLAEAVARLPGGYQTRIGESAADALPGGTRQRISIARALAADRPVILFDEANRTLDIRGDSHVRRTIQGLQGRHTIVIVSHRPSLLALADRLYDLRDGRLHEAAGGGADDAGQRRARENAPA